MATDIVVVTGGNGCLGQHVIRMLQLQASHVKQIRVLDVQPFSKKLEYEEKIHITCITGSVADKDTVRKACRGANAVLHLAGKISIQTFPDIKGMETVNVKGTETVIEACLLECVERLIYCSSVDTVVGYDDIINGTETSTNTPPVLLMGGYAETKLRAENLVLKASNQKHQNGNLRAISLRPTTMYGELDVQVVTKGLESAEENGGVALRIANDTAGWQLAYVGNVAWGFVCAETAMKAKPELSGQSFFITDDTPIYNSSQFMEPYMNVRGFKQSPYKLPLWLLFPVLYMIEFILWLLSPVKKINFPICMAALTYVSKTFSFSYQKAQTLLGYRPFYTAEEAQERSMKYYSQVQLSGQ